MVFLQKFQVPPLEKPGELGRYSDSLRAGRYRDRIPVGVKFSAPVQTGPGAYPASCTMGTGSFPGVKGPGRGADHPPLSKCRSHERVELYLYSPSGPQWPVIWRTFTFTLPIEKNYCILKCNLLYSSSKIFLFYLQCRSWRQELLSKCR